jgi:Sigma-70 region 2
MQDRELVAAIIAGNPDALAEAYDRYAAPLYTYCRFMLPDPRPPGEAADAVADTFIIATAKLPGLREPDRLGSWLHAVARNECLRPLGPAGFVGSGKPVEVEGPVEAGGPVEIGGFREGFHDEAVAPAGLAAAGVISDVTSPAGLRERVLKECADDTPTGRAHRVSVTHRAGTFGRTGFPRPIIPSGPRWWHEVRRHPRAAAGVVAVAIAVVVAGTTALLIAGGPHRAQASTVALGGGDFATSSPVSSLASGPAGGRSSPSRKPALASSTPGASTSAADQPTAGQSTSPGTSQSPAQSSSAPSGSPSPSQSSPAAPSSSPSPSPVPGTLQVVPNKLNLSAVKGKAASGTFLLTAVGGPVNFVITSSNAKVTVSPASGSLGSAGSWVTVTVTVNSLVAVDASLTVQPGKLIVTVEFTIKA